MCIFAKVIAVKCQSYKNLIELRMLITQRPMNVDDFCRSNCPYIFYYQVYLKRLLTKNAQMLIELILGDIK